MMPLVQHGPCAVCAEEGLLVGQVGDEWVCLDCWLEFQQGEEGEE